ncbi:hypothetical protein L9F63_018134 [Diploptera punctata]|uniref:Lipase domain-containing protein n=1 Tax=Diploptera punctata TaxID=6984 RepID=A0AAD8EFI5_DIPPU|nr:hypothetical protein L9F63_018134 [Diploptera punctata]
MNLASLLFGVLAVGVFLLGSAVRKPIGQQGVDFQLYTRKLDSNGNYILADSPVFVGNNFNPMKPTEVIVHGFNETSDNKYVALIRDGYLETTDYNVVMVNWGPLARGPYYDEATQNVYNVAPLLSDYLDFLVRTSNRSLVRGIGFDLGAQILAVAAQKMKRGPLAQITALDPAKPIFEFEDNTMRLDKGDAEFVEVIHTAGGFLSFSENIGHVDIYPNGGVSPQPGCLEEMERATYCSHRRAYEYYAQSLRHPKLYPASLCSSWSEYKDGKCTENEKIYIGDSIPARARGSFYLDIHYGTSSNKAEVVQTTYNLVTEAPAKISNNSYSSSCLRKYQSLRLFDIILSMMCIFTIFLSFYAIILAFLRCITGGNQQKINENKKNQEKKHKINQVDQKWEARFLIYLAKNLYSEGTHRLLKDKEGKQFTIVKRVGKKRMHLVNDKNEVIMPVRVTIVKTKVTKKPIIDNI